MDNRVRLRRGLMAQSDASFDLMSRGMLHAELQYARYLSFLRTIDCGTGIVGKRSGKYLFH
jgi:hypothetical protein